MTASDPRPITSNVGQILAWKKAIAANNAMKRNKRGRRPAKPIVGVRIPAPPRDAA